MCGVLAGRAAVARVQDPFVDVDVFSRVLRTVESDYVEPVPTGELVDAALQGMMKRLDGQSRWLDDDQLRELRDDAEGTTTGLGIEVTTEGEAVAVVRVDAGSPAARDGLLAGDRILEVDGEPVNGRALGHVRATLAGDRGQVAELTVQREGWSAPRTIRTVRDAVHRRVVSAHRFDDGGVRAHRTLPDGGGRRAHERGRAPRRSR